MTNPPGITPSQSPDPMQTTPSPASTATVPQQPAQPAPPTSAQPTTVVKPVPFVPPHVAKLAALQQGFQTLAGTASNYSVDPATGKTVETPVQQAPGQLWRNILASAIMGGAAAQSAHNKNPYTGFGGGAVTGAAASIQDARQQDVLKRQQAQQQFQNQQAASQNNREQDEAQVRMNLDKANIVRANADTLRINQITQGASFQLHQDVAKSGLANTKTYTDSGIAPVVADIPESQMAQYIHDHPGASSLDWEHTGVQNGVDSNGQPTYEYTMTAFDPKGPVTISKATVDQWKKDGVFDRYPEYEAQLKPGKTIPAQAFIAIKQQADSVKADTLQRQSQDLSTKLTQAKIDQATAATAHELAETAHTRQEISEAALGKKTSEQLGHALQDLNNAGGDFSKMLPSSRLLIAESANKMVSAMNAEYSNILKDPTNPDAQQQAGEVLKQIQSWTTLGTQAITSMAGGGKVAHPEIVGILSKIPNVNPQAVTAIANMSVPEIVANLKTSTLPLDTKNEILKSIGQPPMAAPAPASSGFASGIAPSPAVGNALNSAATSLIKGAKNIPVL